MSFPTFFDQVPTISLRDPLAEFLGAASDGIIEYTYTDIVKLAGHSCPTVAGAYLMTIKALQKLYGNALPERGAIKVEFSDSQLNGVTGIIQFPDAIGLTRTTPAICPAMARQGKTDFRECRSSRVDCFPLKPAKIGNSRSVTDFHKTS